MKLHTHFHLFVAPLHMYVKNVPYCNLFKAVNYEFLPISNTSYLAS
jgi:hypothetical protein